MDNRKMKVVISLINILVMTVFLLAVVGQTMAETMNFKFFNHVTKAELITVADAEGHVMILQTREGVAVFENGEWAWIKAAITLDLIKGVGAADEYLVFTFLDKSTIATRMKGTAGVPPGNVSVTKWTGDIIGGTARFQGINGTITNLWRLLPPEKGETAGKCLADGTLAYTVPSK